MRRGRIDFGRESTDHDELGGDERYLVSPELAHGAEEGANQGGGQGEIGELGCAVFRKRGMARETDLQRIGVGDHDTCPGFQDRVGGVLECLRMHVGAVPSRCGSVLPVLGG